MTPGGIADCPHTMSDKQIFSNIIAFVLYMRKYLDAPQISQLHFLHLLTEIRFTIVIP